MAHSIEITSQDDQIPLLPQTEKDEIEDGSKVDHLIDIINGQDPSGSETKKSLNKIFAEKFKDLDNSSIKSCTIFKVNVWLRETNPDAYTPKMVSIGPYHKKDPRLYPMEKYKLSYLQRFLRRGGLDVESCISELEKLENKALKCYDDVETDDEFCQMLLLDGCFVVEFIREYNGYPKGEHKIINTGVEYIFRDLMLLENQLPFFVLDKLHGMTRRDNDESGLAILAGHSLPSFFKIIPEKIFESHIKTAGDIKHFLHLQHVLSCYGNDKENANNDQAYWHVNMPNATKLSEAGVSFAKVSVTTRIFDSIKFEKREMTIPCFRSMTIPYFKVEDKTEMVLRNLIAYEQQSNIPDKRFSDFAIFMDKLIESDKDVNLLCHKEIIGNWLGDDIEVASLFNKIGNGVVASPNFYYNEECRKAVEHCKKSCKKMMANLCRNYCSGPWVIASTTAAVILLVLTVIQAILSFTGPVLSQ